MQCWSDRVWSKSRSGPSPVSVLLLGVVVGAGGRLLFALCLRCPDRKWFMFQRKNIKVMKSVWFTRAGDKDESQSSESKGQLLLHQVLFPVCEWGQAWLLWLTLLNYLQWRRLVSFFSKNTKTIYNIDVRTPYMKYDLSAIKFMLIIKWLSYGFCNSLNCKPSSIKAPSHTAVSKPTF